MACAVTVVLAGVVQAQGPLVLNVPLKSYRVGAFRYSPPTADGWRSSAVEARALGFVFAERTPAGTVNIRASVSIEAFEVPQGAAIGSGRELTEIALDQQTAQRKAALVAVSTVSTVPGRQGFETYTLVSKAGDTELHETFFVLLAPDRLAYLVAKFATQEPTYRDQLYWAQFYGALNSLRLDG